ncbi:MAG: site-specific integrase [Oxalobacteraceae bacterium]|nr:site-specific integrase [Oxalobacteraceae bacterium]
MARKTLNFTKDALEKLPLPAAGQRVEYYDAKVPGLCVRVSSTGAKAFAVVRWIKDSSKPERVTIGRFPAVTIEQARRKAGDVNHAVSRGENPAAAIREKRAELTLAEGFDAYVSKHLKPHGRRTTDALRASFEVWLSKLPDAPRKLRAREREKPEGSVDWSARKLSAIKPQDVRRLHAAIGATGKRTMANRVVELLSTMFNKLSELGEFKGENPAAGVTPYAEVKRDRFIQAGELPRFFDALAGDDSQDFRDFVVLSLMTGARRGNVLAMRWEDLNLSDAAWRVPADQSKNGDAMMIDLVPEALAILRRRLPSGGTPAGFVFPARSKSGHISNPKKRWTALLARAQMRDFRIHDLRRSLGSWQAKTGASLVTIGKSLGHKDPSTTMIYARLDRDPVRAAVEQATGAMLDAAGRTSAGKVIPLARKKARG